jgi:hypothetical protein
VVQARGELDLATEPVDAEARAELGREHLEEDHAGGALRTASQLLP